MHLHQFWFRFQNAPASSPLVLGCGVTAFSHDDALALLAETVFAHGQALPIERVIEDANIDDIHAGQTTVSHDIIHQRGVWFPRGYLFQEA